MNVNKSLKNRIKGWLPKEPKMPSRALYQPMFKSGNGSLLTGIGVALIVLGLGFCFFSSFYVDGDLPVAAVLDVIGHYLEGIAIGCAFLASGVILVVFGIKKSQNNYFTPQIRTLENWIEGWLPKEPVMSLSRNQPSNNALLLFSGRLLQTFGAALAAIFCYSSLLVFEDVEISLSSGWFLLISFLVGVELLIVGTTIRKRTNSESMPLVKRRFFFVGLSSLTICVLGFIFDRFFSLLNMTYPFSIHSLLVRLLIFWRAGWIGLVFLCFSFLGWVLLLASGSFIKLSPTNNIGKRYDKEFYLLTIGAIITLAGVLIQSLSLLSAPVYSLLQPFLFAFYAFVNPFGILCLTLGWVVVASARSKRSPLLLPVLFAIFIGILVVSFSIPI